MKLFNILLLLFISQAILAQDKYNHTHTFQSEAFDSERTIYVHLPKRYFSDTAFDFTVTYILDAQSDNFWNMAKSNINYMVSSYSVMPMIVVGISSDDRGSEFSPPANDLNNHLRNEVFPLIKEKYRVNDFRTIVGHSWGGLYVGDALLSENEDMFNSYLAISPSFDYNNNEMVKRLDSLLQTKSTFQKSFYTTVGDLGRIEFENYPPCTEMDVLMKKYPNSTLDWYFDHKKGNDHWHLVISSISDGLIHMSRNYIIDHQNIVEFIEKDANNIQAQMEAFYKNQKANFGFTYEPSGRYYRYFADDYRDIGKYEIAIQIYQYALAKSPEEVTINMNIADTYNKMQNKAKEKAALEQTIALLEAQKENLKENFYNNCLKWSKDRLAKCE